MSVESSPGSSAQTTLRPNAIGLPGVLFQSITTMAPASAVAFTLGAAAIGFTGGALPGRLAHVNHFRTPDIAIIFTMIVALVCTLWPGLAHGPAVAFNLLGIIIGIPIIIVYMATCLSVPFFYRREQPGLFNVLRHVIVPAIPFVVLAIVLYFQFVPYPQQVPYNLVGWIVAGWFILGILAIIVLSVRSPQALARGSEVYLEE